MKGERAFFDTNVLVYAFAADDPRSAVAESLLARGGTIGVQNLNEFASVATRKLGMNWDEVEEALDTVRTLCAAPAPLTVHTHEAAVRIARQYGYSIYDALVIAAALEKNCTTLYSEDMKDGRAIDGLTIRNPFMAPRRPRK